MKSKKKVNINTLADLVFNTFRSDTTAPIPGEPRKGWEGDQLLTGMVDRLMMYLYNDPAGYAQIGRRVAAKVHDLPEMEALAKIAEIRGERLGPASAKRKIKVLALVMKLGPKIRSLPPSPRKERLASLLAYNKGVFYDAYEMFAEAAEMQKQSAEIAHDNGDYSGLVIGQFLQAVYQLKDALCQPSTDEAEGVFSIMGERYAKLVEAVCGTPLEVSWGQGNAPCHMLQARLWLDKDHPGMDKWMASVVSAAGSLQGVWVDIAWHYQTINSFRKGDLSVKAELEKTAAGSGDTTRRAEAILVLARYAVAYGDKKLARKLVSRMPKKGASHLRAIAKRLLA